MAKPANLLLGVYAALTASHIFPGLRSVYVSSEDGSPVKVKISVASVQGTSFRPVGRIKEPPSPLDDTCFLIVTDPDDIGSGLLG